MNDRIGSSVHLRRPSSVLRSGPREIVAQWLRFAVVGVTNTLLSTAVFAALFHVGVPYLLGSSLAFALGALNSYTLNRRWTFRSRGPRAPELARFLCVQGVGLGVNLALLAGLVELAGIHHVVAQVLAFPAASIITFALSRQWAFKNAQWRAAGSG